jgi:hypothetical protein
MKQGLDVMELVMGRNGVRLPASWRAVNYSGALNCFLGPVPAAARTNAATAVLGSNKYEVLGTWTRTGSFGAPLQQ